MERREVKPVVKQELKNAGALLAGRLVAGAASVGIAVAVGRSLGVVGFGTFAAVMAAGFIANTGVTFGTDTVIVRAVARAPGQRSPDAASSLRLQVLVSLVLIVAAGGARLVVGDAATPVLVQSLALVPLSFMTVASATIRGAERMHLQLAATALGAGTSLAAVLIFLRISESVTAAVSGVVVGQTVGAFAAVLFASAHVRFLRVPGRGMGSLLREARVFAAMVILTAAATHGGVLLLEAFDRDAAAGSYGAAHRVIELVRLAPAALFGALFPAMIRGSHGQEQSRRLMRWLSIGGVVVTVVLFLAAGPITELLFDDFPDDDAVLRVLALSIVPVIWRLQLSFSLISRGHERTVLSSAAVALAVAVVIGFVAANEGSAQAMAGAQLAGIAAQVAVLLGATARLGGGVDAVDSAVTDCWPS